MGLESKATILIVDDESEITEFISLALVEEGYATVESTDATKAKKFIEGKPLGRNNPEINIQLDALITDINLPEITGWELSQLYKKLYPDGKVIAISAACDPELSRQALRDGIFDVYICKPFDLNNLVNAVKQLVDEKNN